LISPTGRRSTLVEDLDGAVRQRQPALYYILLRWWMDALGTGAAAARLLSAIFSLAAAAVFFDVCRLLHGARIALLRLR